MTRAPVDSDEWDAPLELQTHLRMVTTVWRHIKQEFFQRRSPKHLSLVCSDFKSLKDVFGTCQ